MDGQGADGKGGHWIYKGPDSDLILMLAAASRGELCGSKGVED